MVLAGVFAIAWAVGRAYVQSVTLDESDTYFWFVANSDVLYPFPNNHVLNTLLIWVTTHVFGLSSLTLRMPALLGAVLYVLVCYFLCQSLTLPFPVFLCLIYNPFLLDFMVAARGYSLANAFLLAAIAIPVWQEVKGRPSLDTSCLLASLALGLSFASNFSFAFADLAAFLALAIWAGRRGGAAALARCIVPGLLVALAIGGYTLAHLKKGDLYYGAHSLGEMTRSLVDATLYHLNPRFGGSLYKVTRAVYPWLLPALGVFCICRLVVEALDGSWRDTRVRFAGTIGSVAGLSVLLHWLAFRLAGLPLPLSRTGIFLVPLCTLFLGAVASGPAGSAVSRWIRWGMNGTFWCLGFYFLLCLRGTYFKEYEYDRDVKEVYAVLAGLNHRYGVTEVSTSGVYASPLNFYRVASGKETLEEFKPTVGEFPVGKPVYVMHGPFEKPFIEREGLAIIYRGRSGEVVVAVRPGGAVPTDLILPALEPSR
jgi:hypothetical protein